MPGAADIMHHVMYMYITQVKNVKRNAKSMDEYHIASVKKNPCKPRQYGQRQHILDKQVFVVCVCTF